MEANKILPLIILFFLSVNLFAQDCEEFEVAGESCDTAPFICDLEGYCSNNYQAVSNGTPNAFCGQVETDVWLAFRAGTTNLEIEIEPYDCQNNNGIQAAMFSTTNCSTYTLVSNCFDAGSPQIFILETQNLVVGNTYYIMIDGKGGDRCNFTFNLLAGTTIVPEWSIAGENVFGCPDESTVLNGQSTNNSAAAQFSWITDDGNIVSGENTLTPTVDLPGTYSLIVTDNAQSCTDTSSVVFDFYPDILLNIPSPQVIDCVENQTVTIDLEISGVDDPYTFSWQNVNGNEVGTDQTLVVDAAGIYSVVVTNQTTGCTEFAETEVFADVNTPVALIDAPMELDCLTDTITLTAGNSSQNPDFISTWTTTDGSIISNPQGLAVDVNLVGIYTLNILNPDNGCEATDMTEVTRNEAEPKGIFSTVKNPCFDETTGNIRLDSVLNGNPDYLFAIDSSAFTAELFYPNLAPGSYTFTVQDALGCQYDTIIQIIPQDQIVVDLRADFEIILGDSLPLRPDVSEEGLTFTWLESNPYLSCYDCENPIVSPLESDYYQLLVEDENGCFASDTLTIFVNEKRRIFFPDIFSPNGDGVNDILYLFGGNDVEKVISLQIYDRWGELLLSEVDFLPNDPMYGFDGTHRGKTLNSGTLAWVAQVQFIDGEIEWFKGVSMLIR